MNFKDGITNAATVIVTICAVIITGVVVNRQMHPVAVASGIRREDRMIVDWKLQAAKGRLIGSPQARVTVLEYADFECPACLGFFRDIEKVRAAHPSEINISFRHFPLKYHRQAYPSARAAECAATQGSFEKMYQALYETHDSLGVKPYREIAHRAGVSDLDQFDRCFADTSKVARIEADLKAGETTDIPGTPGVIINGKLWLKATPRVVDLENIIKQGHSSN